MASVLYSIVIFPLVQVLELFFLFIYRVSSGNPGIALCGVSLAITVLTLPLYMKAEVWQANERNIQQKMAEKIKKIKSAFKGDEQYMILSTYYRQNHYHPVYAMRSTFGLLIQIPFFIAAWSYLSRLEVLNGYSFMGIADLGAPDGLLQMHTIRINVLPIIMTIINVISGIVYTKGFSIKEKAQLYSMAALFLILLYNSPAGLVLYWTFNNLFSLIKNIIMRFRISEKLLFFALLILIILFDAYILFIHPGALIKRLLLVFMSVSLIAVLLMKHKIKNTYQYFHNKFLANKSIHSENSRFFISISILFFLVGLVIPSALILSSPGEFSFVESYTSPFPFLCIVLMQSFGVFVFWPICLYFFFSKNIRQHFSVIFSFISLLAMANTFLVFDNFGFLTNVLVFSEPKPIYSNIVPITINIFVLITLSIFFCFFHNRFIFRSIQIITLSSLMVMGIINVYKIQSAFNILAGEISAKHTRVHTIEPFFNFSKEEKMYC